MRGAFLLKKL